MMLRLDDAKLLPVRDFHSNLHNVTKKQRLKNLYIAPYRREKIALNSGTTNKPEPPKLKVC